MLKVSAIYLEKQKSFILDKISSRPLSKTVFSTDPIFSEGFGSAAEMIPREYLGQGEGQLVDCG